MVTAKPSKAARALRAWRGARPQHVVAKLLGAHQSGYCVWETGRVTPVKATRARIEKKTSGRVKAGDWDKS